MSLPRLVAAEEPTLLGFPAEVEPADDDGSTVLAAPAEPPPPAAGSAPESPVRLVILPRADPLAGIALVLAGGAAAVSLWLPWVRGATDTGLSLLLAGSRAAGSSTTDVSRSGLWQPVTIVLGGGSAAPPGRASLPPRTDAPGRRRGRPAARELGGRRRLLPDRARPLELGSFDSGLWFAVAVPVLGLLGALKAMLTTPRVDAAAPAARPEVSPSARVPDWVGAADPTPADPSRPGRRCPGGPGPAADRAGGCPGCGHRVLARARPGTRPTVRSSHRPSGRPRPGRPLPHRCPRP